MARAKHVASFLLSISKPGTSWSITPLKLQKLLYYCQGWHMAFNDGAPLFVEDLEAWDHGPVVRDIYFKYKNYRYLTIPPSEVLENEDGNFLLNDNEVEIINSVWENYGQYDGKYLEELTHQESPWLETPKGAVIKKEKIFDFFSELADV